MIEVIAAIIIGAGFLYFGLKRYYNNKNKDKRK